MIDTAEFYLTAEWAPQEAILLSAPLNPVTWERNRTAMEKAYAFFAASVTRFETLYLNCVESAQDHWRELILNAGAAEANLHFLDIPTNDAWCRDHGPVTLINEATGQRLITDFTYNAWGGKFPPWDLDNAVPEKIADFLRWERRKINMICEGGALETNGARTLLTTESVVLNPNRNPGMTKADAEKTLCDALGMDQVLWLPSGLPGDDTDGHIDTLARFCSRNTVLAPLPEKQDHSAGADTLRRNYSMLEKMRLADGSKLEVVPLPAPDLIVPENWREEVLPATYANFLIANDAVFAPVYMQPRHDEAALRTLEQAFPGRDIIPVDCTDILLEGGALHCLSQNLPK